MAGTSSNNSNQLEQLLVLSLGRTQARASANPYCLAGSEWLTMLTESTRDVFYSCGLKSLSEAAVMGSNH